MPKNMKSAVSLLMLPPQLQSVSISKLFFFFILQEEIDSIKILDSCQSTDILQRIWAKALNHVYKRDTESFEMVAQFVLQHTESMLFGVCERDTFHVKIHLFLLCAHRYVFFCLFFIFLFYSSIGALYQSKMYSK